MSDSNSIFTRLRTRRAHRLVVAHSLLAALLLATPLHCIGGADIYSYSEPDGSVHLSNVPDDVRYSPLGLAAEPADPAQRVAAAKDPAAGAALRRQYTDIVDQAGARFGVEPALLHAVIAVESAYNPNARSNRGAAGLMQLMPDTAKRYGVANAFDPAQNVHAGAQYLRDLMKLFDNDMKLTLAAYNAGEAAVIRYGRRIPPYRETAAYVPLVVGRYQKNLMSM